MKKKRFVVGFDGDHQTAVYGENHFEKDGGSYCELMTLAKAKKLMTELGVGKKRIFKLVPINAVEEGAK